LFKKTDKTIVIEMTSCLGLIPARSGSKRVPGKNIIPLAGHPMIAYTIAAARSSGVLDRIIVSTDSELIKRIAIHYGAEVPFLRPEKYATTTSPDIKWIKHALSQLAEEYDAFMILRPTSPFRLPQTIRRAWKRFLDLKNIDSLRAVELCHEHPGKMWSVKGDRIKPLLGQSHLKVPWHAGQYQALPQVYIQNSSLEVAWSRVTWQHNSREGKVIAPFFTEWPEGLSIDNREDIWLAQRLIEMGEASLPKVDYAPFELPKEMLKKWKNTKLISE
jgi:CMP-N,N'-diacetyllegionaminic acid synthase